MINKMLYTPADCGSCWEAINQPEGLSDRGACRSHSDPQIKFQWIDAKDSAKIQAAWQTSREELRGLRRRRRKAVSWAPEPEKRLRRGFCSLSPLSS